jgi:hypothetical protein
MYFCIPEKTYNCNSGLCGNGAIVLLMNEELRTKISDFMGNSYPRQTRIEAFKVCQVLLVRVILPET